MQPDHETDELQALLHEEYGAPRLDDQFSADLIGRLQAEAALSSTPTKSRRSLPAICLGVATVAALVIAVIWISNLGVPGANQELAHRASTDSDPSARPVASREIDESVKNDSIDSESRSEPPVASKSRPSFDFSRTETYNLRVRELGAQSVGILNRHKEWRNISAMVAHADMLYIVDSGHLYEVSPNDGSYGIVGDDDWQNTAAMGVAGGHLYIVSDNQLYEVNPTTGARRSLGKPQWAETEAIVTVGDKLYIVGNGLLHRVNPNDGSHEVLHNKNDSTNDPRQRKQ